MCSFLFFGLAGPFSRLVGSFTSFLRCTDSDRLILNFTPFSFYVPVPASLICNYPCCPVALRKLCPVTVKEIPPKRKSKLHPSSNAKRFAPSTYL